MLADNFFQGAFGGSFLNHQYLICACAPYDFKTAADPTTFASNISAVEADGVSLKVDTVEEPGLGHRRRAGVRQRQRADAGLLRRQHDAAAVRADGQQAAPAIRATAI